MPGLPPGEEVCDREPLDDDDVPGKVWEKERDLRSSFVATPDMILSTKLQSVSSL